MGAERTYMTNLPQTQITTYRGFEVSFNPQSPQQLKGFIHGLRRPCRDLAHAEQIIDTCLDAAPQETGLQVTVLSATPRNLLTAGACRNRAEQARAQGRSGGRWVKEGAA